MRKGSFIWRQYSLKKRIGTLQYVFLWLHHQISHTQFLPAQVKIIRAHLILLPDSSVGKESTCNAGDPSSIPESGRSPGDRIGYPLHYSWASLVAQLVKNHLQCKRPGSDPWVGKIHWRRDRLPTPLFLGFPCGSAGKESACSVRDLYWGLRNHSRWWLQTWNSKMLAPWKKSSDQRRQHIKKQRHYFAN